MFTILAILMIILAVLLIAVVLLQPGKGDMLAGMSGLSGTFSSMFGTRRAMDLLTKITIGFAATLMALALITNLFFVGKMEQEGPKAPTEGMELPSAAPSNPGKAMPPMPAPAQQQKK